MSNYFATSYRDLERIGVRDLAEDFAGLGKGNIKTEASKFMFNGLQSYIDIEKNIQKVPKQEHEFLYERFKSKYLENEDINTKPLNPRVIALCYIFCVYYDRGGQIIFFSRERADYLVRALYSLKQQNNRRMITTFFHYKPISQFIKNNGINEIDIVRYLIFIENMENNKSN